MEARILLTFHPPCFYGTAFLLPQSVSYKTTINPLVTFHHTFDFLITENKSYLTGLNNGIFTLAGTKLPWQIVSERCRDVQDA